MDRMVGDPAWSSLGPASRISEDAMLHLADRGAWGPPPEGRVGAFRSSSDPRPKGTSYMVALVVLLLLLLLLGGFGFAAHVLWFILIVALVIWAIGFFIGGAGTAAGGG